MSPWLCLCNLEADEGPFWAGSELEPCGETCLIRQKQTRGTMPTFLGTETPKGKWARAPARTSEPRMGSGPGAQEAFVGWIIRR